jgi:hypothetical protein
VERQSLANDFPVCTRAKRFLLPSDGMLDRNTSMMELDLSYIEKQLVADFRNGEWAKAMQVIELTRDRKIAEQAESEAKERRKAIEEQLATLTGATKPAENFKGRKIRLRVTSGSRGYGYLLVTRALEERLLSPTEKLKIHVPATGDTFVTDIYVRNKHLKERHGIKRFYKAVGMARGDSALLDEIKPGEWVLTKVPGSPAPAPVQQPNGGMPPAAPPDQPPPAQ